ncbi:MAG: DUF5763 domain-containing protein [Lyngbya sp.]|nr:DUF5763 domain-containing protein [Lyngbya sp.]
MSSNICKAVKKSGEQCKLKANSSGYCHIHYPEKIAERKAKQKANELVRFEMPSKTFSQRRGLKAVPTVIQVESMNQDLRNSLWNVLSENFFREYSNNSRASYYGVSVDSFVKYIWKDHFKKPLETLSLLTIINSMLVEDLLDYFQNREWYEVYDFLEIAINYFKSPHLVKEINYILERELAGYRFVGNGFTPITNEQEVEMLECAVEDKDFPAVASHLKCALSLMSNRENPDYRNSIKESISAVESLAKHITGKPKATLAEALKTLESSKKLHPALKKSFESLYGYTSDEGGIRHAMLNDPNLTAHDAKFFLLSCTSFINYLKSKI